MHATCERRNDAKPSSEDAVVDVEVDRCIDENSALNRDKVALLSPKLHRSIHRLENLNPNYNLEPVHQTSPKRASRELQFYRFSITREAPTTDFNKILITFEGNSYNKAAGI